MNQKYKVLGLFTARPEALPNGQISAIRKKPQSSLNISIQGIENDEVANQKYHGGEMRVIHHYSQINYHHLMQTFPEIKDRFTPGSFGENLYTEELTESELFIGDIYTLGTAKIQLTVSRRPCATINQSYQDNRILKEVLKTGRSGWFYRVLQPGVVKVGDWLELVERPYPALPIWRLHEQGYGPSRYSDQEFLRRCLDSGLMDKGWKPTIEHALAN